MEMNLNSIDFFHARDRGIVNAICIVFKHEHVVVPHSRTLLKSNACREVKVFSKDMDMPICAT